MVPMPNLILLNVDYIISPHQYPRTDERCYDAGSHGKHFVPEQLFIDIEALPGEKMWLSSWGKRAEQTFQRGWLTAEHGHLVEVASSLAYRLRPKNIVWFDSDCAQEIVGTNTLPIKARTGLCPADVERAARWLQKH